MRRLACLTLLAGCAHYAPQPLDTPALVEQWRTRSLADTALRQAVAERAGAVENDAWSSAQLAVAALLRHPEVTEAQAALDVARAGEVSAGARPQLGVSGEIGRATDPGPFESPWFGIAAARSRTARAAVDVAGATWAVALRTHEVHAATLAADSLAAALDAERASLATVIRSARRRLEAGEVASSEVARLTSEQATLEIERSRIDAQREGTRQDLARALALPRSHLGDIAPRPDRVDGCRATEAMPLETLESRALTQRAEVGRSLAGYAEAEAALRLEVARSWPDLVLGPGFVWDGGVHRWNLFASLPELMLNRNRGPIGEATARRAAVAVHVDAMQQEVLADVATARAACTGAMRELATSDSAVSALAREAEVVAGAVERGERGERDRLAVSLVQARAGRERQQAAARVVQAGLALERAVGGWLADPAPLLAAETEVGP